MDQWRAVLEWSEAEVWAIIRRWKIRPHPAYLLSWGRESCLCCIFGGPDQWASVRAIARSRFDRIAAYEEQFGVTIKRNMSVVEAADKGESFVDLNSPWVAVAMGTTFPASSFILPENEEWTFPAGDPDIVDPNVRRQTRYACRAIFHDGAVFDAEHRQVRRVAMK